MEPILIAADSPDGQRRFRSDKRIPYPMLCDEDHAVADRYGLAISRKHPKAKKYQDGFIQPAVFVYEGDEEIYSFVQKPKMLNMWGAARRPTAEQIVASIHARLAAATQ